MVDSPADMPVEDRTDRRGSVRRVDRAALAEPLPGLWMQPLADPESGSDRTVVNYMEVGPGSARPGIHTHEFDQYYLVLEGELTVEVALEKHVVGTRVARRRAAPAVQRRGRDREAHRRAGTRPGTGQAVRMLGGGA
ncbi:hypothetical protein FHX44_118212 [Pseudonocardia hierapolitana]|uniref:Cupin domain n=1 Tax=Pseudonocardia hierapolitana TaxID=1128676 RepID=A0A561T576_9PSEU|nr:hypothetical protein FHX44_118212 [Pseudonocardia hierapolitana]